MRVIIDSSGGVTVRCECSLEGRVADLEAAVVWAFHEALRHGPGSHFKIAVDITLDVEHVHAAGQPSNPS